jgi:hypothetical protein
MPQLVIVSDGPLCCGFVIRRAREPGAVHVGEHVLDPHDLGMFHSFLADLRVDGRVDLLGGLFGRDDRHKADHEQRSDDFT